MTPIPILVHNGSTFLIGVMRRLDPYYRDSFDRVFQRPVENLVQRLIRLRLTDKGMAIGEEEIRSDEAEVTAQITDAMNRFLIGHYKVAGKTAERAGNTKTYGVVRAEFKVAPDLPESLRVGLFKTSRSFPAYIRFAGPGPLVTPDVDDNGILSIGVKLMDVPGRKLLDDERRTHDFTGISSPTFTTPNIYENLKLQREVGRGSPAWYFLNPLDSHLLDMVMQGLYARIHATPLELTYYSCVPYLFGEGKAVKYALTPRVPKKSRVGELTENFLREAMVEGLKEQGLTFDFAVQFQTDPVTMPLEDASVIWSEREAPYHKLATLEIPPQAFDSPEQLAFARNLSFNPWHCVAEHRPLGNQNRARKAIYQATSRMRQRINREAHIEPNGAERFN